jgi:hypothetical protein
VEDTPRFDQWERLRRRVHCFLACLEGVPAEGRNELNGLPRGPRQAASPVADCPVKSLSDFTGHVKPSALAEGFTWWSKLVYLGTRWCAKSRCSPVWPHTKQSVSKLDQRTVRCPDFGAFQPRPGRPVLRDSPSSGSLSLAFCPQITVSLSLKEDTTCPS